MPSSTEQGGGTPRLRERLAAEDGSAVVEFLGLALVLLIPLIYVMVFVSQVQAGAYAAVAAADQAASAMVTSDGEVGVGRARASALLTLGDYGLDDSAHRVLLSCDSGCEHRAPGDVVRVRVEISVPLPIVRALGGAELTPVTVSSESAQRVPLH